MSARKTARRSTTHRAITLDELTASIRAYAEALGVPVPKVGRDGFLAAHRGRFPKSRELDAIWMLAKSQASHGVVEAPPLEPVPVDHRVAGVSTYVDADGTVKGQWIKTKAKEETPEEMLRRLMADLPRLAPARSTLVQPPDGRLDDDLMACVVLGDGHVGLCSWKPETGANWDLQIAEDVHKAAVADLVARGPAAKRGMLIELGDWLDSDGVNATTTAGTPQDTDTRWHLVCQVGLRIMVHAIDCMLAKHEEVVVDIIPGNHSRSTATLFQFYVQSYYRNEPRVSVVTDPAMRHYHRFGSCLIGTTHGDGPKVAELPEVMAAEVPEMWGATKHRRFYIGHVHHSQAIERRGCTVESFRTLSARSAWAASKGYISKRDASRITFHREFGEVSREICSVEYLMARRGVAA